LLIQYVVHQYSTTPNFSAWVQTSSKLPNDPHPTSSLLSIHRYPMQLTCDCVFVGVEIKQNSCARSQGRSNRCDNFRFKNWTLCFRKRNVV